MSFLWLDYVILAIAGMSALMGMIRGFFREAIGLTAWIVILWVSFANFDKLAPYLKVYIGNEMLRFSIAFTLLFIVIFITVTLVSAFIVKLFKNTGFSPSDKIFGLLFGIGRGVLLVSVLLLAAGLTKMPQTTGWEDSVLVPKFNPIIQVLYNLLPETVADEIHIEGLRVQGAPQSELVPDI